MYKLFSVSILFILFLPSLLFGVEQVSFYMDIWRYQGLKGHTYVASYAEVLFSIDGTTVEYRMGRDSMYQASVNIHMSLTRVSETDTVEVFEDDFRLWSLKLPDTTLESRRSPYIYMQDNPPPLQPGHYVLRATVKDSFVDHGRESSAIREFDILAISPKTFSFSDIKYFLFERERIKPQDASFRKLRKNFVPFVTNGYFLNRDSLKFYLEIYNVDQILPQGADYFLRARVIQNGQPVNSIREVVLNKSKVILSFNHFDAQLDISVLPSGTYYLQVEVVDNTQNQNRTLRQTSRKFHVINSRKDPGFDTYTKSNFGADVFAEYDEQELNTYLRTLIPISTEQEKRFIQTLLRPVPPPKNRSDDFLLNLFSGNAPQKERLRQKRNYLYSFWEKRRETPQQSVASLWNAHLTAVKYCNQHFTSELREGWQTDRGRVFLKYKVPTELKQFPAEANTVPYEIWRYDRLDQQSKVEFIFYDPELTGEYLLLHSTKYGELHNPRWQEQLLNRGRIPAGLDVEGNKRQLRNNPR